MLHDPARLEAALAPLVGLPLWKSHRAADVQVFQFGDKRTVTSKFGPRKGQESEVGEHALHVQCCWRIRGPRGIVAGSRDDANRCDDRIRRWIEPRTYDVERVDADTAGGIVLVLAAGFCLEVFPDSSLDDEYSEQWRLLRPGDVSSHFVVSGRGIDAGTW